MGSIGFRSLGLGDWDIGHYKVRGLPLAQLLAKGFGLTNVRFRHLFLDETSQTSGSSAERMVKLKL